MPTKTQPQTPPAATIKRPTGTRRGSAGADTRRISISLTGRAAETVRVLAGQLGISEGDVVRRALALLAEVTTDTEAGAALLLRQPSGETERVRFLPNL